MFVWSKNLGRKWLWRNPRKLSERGEIKRVGEFKFWKRKAGRYYRWREWLNSGHINHHADDRSICQAEQGSHRDKAWALGPPMRDSQSWNRGCFHATVWWRKLNCRSGPSRCVALCKDIMAFWFALEILCVPKSLELESVFHKII